MAKQSLIDRDFDKALDVIAPCVCTGKKITQREIKKAQTALDQAFGKRSSVDGEYQYSLISVSLSKGYFNQVNLFHQDRSIQGNQQTHYIHDDQRSINCDSDTGAITAEEMARYKRNKNVITEEEAQALIEQHNALEEQIKALKDQQSEIQYHYYLTR